MSKRKAKEKDLYLESLESKVDIYESLLFTQWFYTNGLWVDWKKYSRLIISWKYYQKNKSQPTSVISIIS